MATRKVGNSGNKKIVIKGSGGSSNTNAMISGCTFDGTAPLKFTNIRQISKISNSGGKQGHEKNVMMEGNRFSNKSELEFSGMSQVYGYDAVGAVGELIKQHQADQDEEGLDIDQNDQGDLGPSNDNFEYLAQIGQGAFGAVFRVRHKLDDGVYVIKKINVEGKPDELAYLKEVRTLHKVKGDRIVNYITCWIEKSTLHIQMECCATNLRHYLNEQANLFGRHSTQLPEPTEYYISCRLFEDTLLAVQYLHNLSPPVIHRDLKPENILLNLEPVNGVWLKLADFGLATLHKVEDMSHTTGVGTARYVAPEVLTMKQYDWRADIYSLSIIAQELFNIDINDSMCGPSTDRMEALTDLIGAMNQTRYRNRPSCSHVLSRKNEWFVELGQLANETSKKTQFNNGNDFARLVENLLK